MLKDYVFWLTNLTNLTHVDEIDQNISKNTTGQSFLKHSFVNITSWLFWVCEESNDSPQGFFVDL
jgi:hypothetical protein